MSSSINVISGLQRRSDAVLRSSKDTWQSNISIFFEYLNDNPSLKRILDELKDTPLPNSDSLFEKFNQRRILFSNTYREKIRECLALLLSQLIEEDKHSPWSLMSNNSATRNIDALTREYSELVFRPFYEYIVERMENINNQYLNDNNSTVINSNEIFISYSTTNKDIAGKISNYLRKRGFETFLAHENIEINDVWRDEIRKHLDTCKGLVAVITDDFIDSCWTHQECGYIMGTKKPIVSLFYSSKKSGFLESRQGIPMSGKTIEDVIDEIARFFNEK